MTALDRIRWVSRWMRIALWLGAIGLIVGLGIFWLTSSPELLARSVGEFPRDADAERLAIKRALGLAISLAPALVTAGTLIKLSDVFARFSRGEIFRRETVSALHGAAILGFAAVAAKLLAGGALSVAMSYDNPPGERMLALTLSSNDVLFVLTSATFLVIAWVLAEARRVSDDLDQIV